MSLLLILSIAVSLFTEAVKKFLDEANKKYSSNMVVLVLSIIVGAGGTAIMYLFFGIAFTIPNIVCIGLMAIAVWVGAMVGYDKVMQLIEQLKNLK
jgi:amino acid transporter